MADPNQNPPPLLLFPASDSLAPDAFRPVPATASLFPTEDGEADSFLGQTAEPSVGQTTQPQIPFFTTASSASASDPFANISQPASLPTQAQQSTTLTTNPTQPPLYAPSSSCHQPVSFSSPAPPQPSQQYSSGPPIGTPSNRQGPPMSAPHDPNAPPPTGPPQGRTGGFGGVKLGQGYKPVLHPMGGVGSTPTSTPPMGTLPLGGPPMGAPPTGAPPTGPPGLPMFDSSRPPPTSADLHHAQSTGPQSGASPGPGGTPYHPVQPHWFYCKEFDRGEVWNPFSIMDSIRLDEALHASYNNLNEDIIISTNGGRYDVNIQQRQRHAVYWDERPSSVRRCTWFYKSDGENRFLPYEEALADKLEQEYETAVLNNVWHKRLEFADGETIVMHNPNVIVHFRPPSRADDFGTSPDGQMRPRVVKRGVDDVENIDQGEPNQIDHLVFIAHGIGPVCDLRFRGIVECVDDFRSVSLGLMRSHFKHSQEDGRTGRIEFLPVYWYDALHGDATGVDRRLRRITLPSISRLRRFTNDTLLDILFYSSPSYSQKIAEHVCSEINRLYQLFQDRNPDFRGQASIVGHSLGSLIVFDLLSHQGDGQPNLQTTDSHTDTPVTPDQSLALPGDELTENVANEEAEEEVMTLDSALAQLGLIDFLPKFQEERIDIETLLMCSDSDLKEMGLPLGPRKKLGGFLKEQATKEERNRKAREARMKAEAEKQAREVLERERQEASSASQFNDVSAHSVHIDFEPGSEGVGQPLVRYSQLDFKPQAFFAIGSPIGMFLTVRGVSRVGEEYKLPTCDGFFNMFHPFDPVAYRMEPLVHSDMADVKPFLMPHHKGRKRFHLELRESLSAFGSDLKRNLIDSMKKTWKSIHEFALAHRSGAEAAVPAVSSEEMEAVAEKLSMEEMARQEQEREGLSSGPSTECELRLGQLNNGRRIDYVLQEAPLESFNEYLFALGSHTCYWDSEDTVLLILKEVYASLGVFPLVHGPKQDSTPATPLHH
ncbi:phospholipase DDHD2-like isoform X2 [Patiria miniata]|uniref:DDHD domain-containing protein n=1 Tax=Patiria miniata TaxID=46514 RepID=A0A913Z1B2_PATMI|nr:phospholipase DDHD2-like isoform X2 [Patiria miniata]